MANIGPAPGVRIPWPDVLKELREGRMPVAGFIWAVKDMAAAATMGGMWRGNKDNPEPGSLPQKPPLTYEERARRVLKKP